MTEITVSGNTRLFGIIGDPVAQVKTPLLMNALFQRYGVDAVLVPLQVPTETFEAVMCGLMALKNLEGLVITVPHKVRASALADTLSSTARQVGSVNVLRREEGGRWFGDMFDGVGLVAGLRAQGFHIAGQRVKQLGAGGSGMAAAFALAEAGVRSLTLSDPDGAAAEALAYRISQAYPHCAVSVGVDDADITDVDLLLNCSPVGMKEGEGMPAPFGAFPSRMQVVDIIMQPEETPLLRHARRYGCQAINGRPMIEGQIQAFAAFFGVHCGEEA